MKIVFLCFAGTREWSDLDLEAGLGGSETMIVLFARQLATMGHLATVLGPVPERAEGERERVSWLRCFPEDGLIKYPDVDVVISLRDPRPLSWSRKVRCRAFLANDQSCCYLPEEVADGNCNLVITISQFQTDNYQRMYPTIPKEMYLTSNAGVEWEAYQPPGQKTPGLCWYGSTPERGLVHLLDLWPRIHEQVPYARLVISSGFELYGFSPEHCERQSGGLYDRLSKLSGVTVTGMLPRSKLQELQQKAELMLYPSTYAEQCCIAVMEAQAAGMVVVTSMTGALTERIVYNATGKLIWGIPGDGFYDDSFVKETVGLLNDHDKMRRMGEEARHAVRRFGYDRLCEQWMQRFLQFKAT